jgi:DNA replication protein DnaC
MKSMKDLMARMNDGEFRAIPPTTSSDDPGDGGLCSLCGQASLCAGLGTVRYNLPVDHPDFGKLFRCPNYVPQVDPERLNRLRKIGNLEAYTDKTFNNFYTDLPGLSPVQRQSLASALNLARAYAAQPDGWLMLEGTYGSGKTHLAAAVGNMRLQYGDAVLFITSPDLLDYLRSSYAPNAESGYDEMFDRLRNAPVLILDDLGVENPSGWAQEKLFQLLNHRYSRLLPTVITTNADIDLLDPRIRSRLMDESVIQRARILSMDYRNPGKVNRDQLTDLGHYHDMRLDNFDTRTGLNADERQNLEKAAAAAQEYARSPQGWIVFTGKYFGCGKTHLAASIALECQERGYTVLFATVPDLFDHLRMSLEPGAPIAFSRRWTEVRDAPLLVLDDLGTESPTAWAKEKLFQIVNQRYVRRLPTVITTSRAVGDLEPRIYARLIDRRLVRIFEITAPTYVTRINRK